MGLNSTQIVEVSKHPAWWVEYLKGGETRVLIRATADALSDVAKRRIPESLPEILSRAPRTSLGRMGATQEYLYSITRWLKPTIVLETGVFRGISSAFILKALEDNQHGRLISIDMPSRSYVADSGTLDSSILRPGLAPGFVIPLALKHRWTLVLGESKKLLPVVLDQTGEIDLFYHDSEHTYDHMIWEFRTVYPYLRQGGLLTSDDVDWNNAFSDFTQECHLSTASIVRHRLGVVEKP